MAQGDIKIGKRTLERITLADLENLEATQLTLPKLLDVPCGNRGVYFKESIENAHKLYCDCFRVPAKANAYMVGEAKHFKRHGRTESGYPWSRNGAHIPIIFYEIKR